MKRKQVDGTMNAQTQKRRRETAGGGGDEGDSYDMDGNVQGAKHWTDEEKTKLFTWLMGPGQEEHWNSLRATKNSCLREVRPHASLIQLSTSQDTFSVLQKFSEAKRHIKL